MEMNLQKFILEHENDDPDLLVLQRDRYPETDVAAAARCIHGRKIIRYKIPSWYKVPTLLFPSAIPIEQCSSEATASYKRKFVPDGSRIADFTGGLGADTYFMSLKSSFTEYFERNRELSEIASHNFRELGTDNIKVTNAEISPEYLKSIPDNRFDLAYLDPARRGKRGERVYSIHDCEPDISILKDELLRIAGKVLVKLSPMADVSALAKEVPETSEIHVIAVNNECKEILLVLSRGTKEPEPVINAVDLGTGTVFSFCRKEEKESPIQFASKEEISQGKYLCIPSAAILKAGPFKLTASRFGIKKIAGDTHYYISQTFPQGFPGQIRKIESVYDFDKAFIRNFRKMYPECSVSSRNFHIQAADLSKRMKVHESDRYRLFATTCSNGEKIAILTVPVEKTGD